MLEKKILPLVTAMYMSACGQTETAPDAYTGGENPVLSLSRDDITPPDNSIVGPDNFYVIVRVPGLNPDYKGIAPLEVEVEVTIAGNNATPGDYSDDWSSLLLYTTAEPGTEVSDLVFVEYVHDGLKDGERLLLSPVIISENDCGKRFAKSVLIRLTYEKPFDHVRMELER